jgi:hypothetical protein
MALSHRLAGAALLALLLINGAPAAPQAAYAAVLHVVYPGVALQRAQTQAWLPLTAGAAAPLGAGDRVRTDDTGRARISFWPGADMLLLSASYYQLDALEVSEQTGTRLSAQLSGLAVHHMAADMPSLVYELRVGDAVITRPGELFATWAREGKPLSVTAAAGAVEALAGDDSVTVRAGEGWFRQAGANTVIAFEPPWNAAQMQGLIEGCPSVVDTLGAATLRVRLGPGLGYTAMGGFAYRQQILIMAENESRGWYRIPFLGGFGWVLRAAVETDCQNLPVLPDTTVEAADFVVDVRPDEVDLLQPFFGAPLSNPWFYQYSTARG